MTIINIASMAMVFTGKFLFAVLSFGILLHFVLGIAFRKEARLDWLVAALFVLAGFILSLVVFLKEAVYQFGVMFPMGGNATSWNGILLFLAVGISMIITVPMAAGQLKAGIALSAEYFRTGNLQLAGKSAGKVLASNFSKLAHTVRCIRALDFGGRYD